MRALLDFVPSCCPGCGRNLNWNRLSTGDYLAFASQSCSNCGIDYQLVSTEALLDAAEAAGGDLKRWSER